MADRENINAKLGVVIIGRNEGERLVKCLASVTDFGGRVVYVDSGSTDGSVAAAQAAGAHVVALDMSQPFTAARARNEGIAVLGLDPNNAFDPTTAPEFIQFIDGDCELRPDWLATGIAFLQSRPNVAVVSGRLRERHPDASMYNALCDAEWDGPIGETLACGGIAMMRAAALAQTNLFDGRMIAGEEPELCLRLRTKGWKIWRAKQEMALHDAAMTRFSQFWARMRRGGFAFALWTDMHGRGPDKLGVAQMRRALIWGALIPALIFISIFFLGPWALGLFLIYPVQIARLTARGGSWRNAMLLTIAKFPEAKGAMEYYYRKWLGRPAGLIEHK